MDYERFAATKLHRSDGVGIEHGPICETLFPFQRDMVSWSLRRGRAALFADTGLGKTFMQAEWARHVSQLGRVLILAPLAVAEQTVKESAKIGVAAKYLREDDGSTPIVVTNYEMLSHFSASAFAGVVLDESSILKAYDGATRNAIIGAFARTPYRLACTATPAPNDHTELGNHSEFLGIKSRVEMLAEYFCHDGGETQVWRLKGHAEEVFWRWVCSWGAMVRKPSDLGYADDGYDLPPLRMHEHVVGIEHRDAWASGYLFAPQATTLSDQRATRRATMAKRVAKAAELANTGEPCVVWCELNDEADAVTDAIPGAIQVKGSDSPETKRERLLGFADGEWRVMVSKPSIAGMGLNWQHCSNTIFVGASHSFEQTYQAIRRFWRFGQTRPVDVHVIRAETEEAIVANYRRKEADAERMAAATSQLVKSAVLAEVRGTSREWNEYDPRVDMTIPRWVGEEAA